ncbi:ATP-binding protein [Halosolutus amylolyticus]|uniref:ATP-binding protein n=1 Tax=Halosolutus amylolyticus TaxID=2932267 RepID=A0ABD5PR62_9EURY|nr:ATP-binding protein [Halosolutus amylolyticus]
MKQHPEVNEVQEFLEIASDFEDPLEIIRESLSNAYDAGATEVVITIRDSAAGSDIIIEDDGHGMSRDDLKSFFDLGNSRKTDSIGHKGHGTKIFYKSDRIVVDTAHNGSNFHAVMDRPWEKLNEKTLPEYEVSKTDTRPGNTGTRIQISGFRSGEGFDPQSLTYDKIHHYLKWKTIAGSTAHFFDDSQREMEVVVDLDDEIDDTRDQLTTTNQLTFPREQLQPSTGEFPATRMCKHYPPRKIEFEHDEGSSTVEIVGMIGGKDARNELPTYGRHSVQFGVWLAKDHIKVEQVNEVLTHDNEFIHFFFIANCQDLELAANRGKVRNKASSLYKTLKQELKHYMTKIAEDPWFKEDYLETRKRAQLRRRAQSQTTSLEERLESIDTNDQFKPTNRSEVLLALERSNNEVDNSITVKEYKADHEVPAILLDDDTLRTSHVYVELTEHFEDDYPLGSADTILCWSYGDIDILREYERNGYHGGDVEIDLQDNQIIYHHEDRHTVDIITVSDRLAALEHQPLTSLD